MINGSTAFNAAVTEGGHRYSIRISANGAIVACDIIGCSVYKGSAGAEAFSIGTVFTPYAELTVTNLSVPLENVEILLECGVETSSNNFEWISLGYFKVTKAQSSTVQTVLTAVGRTANALKVVPASITSPITVSAVIQTIQTTVRANYSDFTIDTTGVTVTTETITENLAGLTCQALLEVVTSVVGCWATETNTGGVKLFNYDTTTTLSYDGSRMIQYPVVNDYDFSLTGVKLIQQSAYEDEDGTYVPEVALTSGTPITWTFQNAYIKNQSMLDTLATNCLGLTYRPATIALAYGDPRIEASDVLEITNTDSSTYIVPAMYVVHTLTGGLTTEIVAPGDSSAESDATTTGPISRAIEAVSARLLSAQEAILNRATITELEANYAHMTNGVIDNAHIGHADVAGLSANYAQIDAANINTAAMRTAWVNQVMVQSGLIAQEGQIFVLDAIKVNAANITAGTIDVERLIVTVNNEKYLVHVNPSTGTPTYEKLDGNVIEDLTITADKIVAGAITADKITTSNIVGSGGWINLRSGTFNYVNAITGQGISWDGSQLLINGSVTIGSTVTPISDALEELTQNAENTLIYDHTYTYTRDANNKPISATFTAFLYRGGVDVKTEFTPASDYFFWYLKKEEKTTGAVTEELIGTGYTCTVNLSQCGYGAEIIGKFVTQDNAQALTNEGDNLTNSENENLTVRATGDSVRVRDLTTSSTIFPTDSLMVVGAEDEHLVTIQTLQGYLNANLDKQVLFNTTAGWNSQTSLVSQSETLYVYTDHERDANNNAVAGIKVGDGSAYVVDLPFIDAIATEHIADTSIHVSSVDRTFWNNKVRCYYAGTENLVFTTT